jgi:hypothetical protein
MPSPSIIRRSAAAEDVSPRVRQLGHSRRSGVTLPRRPCGRRPACGCWSKLCKKPKKRKDAPPA